MTNRLLTSVRRRLADWRYPAGYRVAQRGGATWLLNHRHFIDRHMLFDGDYEAAQRVKLFDLARSHDCAVFVDIGANFGLYSVQAALHGSFGSIHAFEPDARNLACLRANLHLNGLLDRVLVHEAALSDHDGNVSFSAAGDKFTGQSRVLGAKTADSIDIPARRLDSLFRPGGGYCLKIDVEGHEIAVLEGARALLADEAWVIQVECLEAKDTRVATFLAALGGEDAGRIGQDRYFVKARAASPATQEKGVAEATPSRRFPPT